MANLNYYANFIKIPVNHVEFLAAHKVTNIYLLYHTKLRNSIYFLSMHAASSSLKEVPKEK